VSEDQQAENQVGDGATDDGVGYVERPPALQVESEQADIKEININEVNYSVETDAIYDIADSAASYQRQGPDNARISSVRVDVVQ